MLLVETDVLMLFNCNNLNAWHKVDGKELTYITVVYDGVDRKKRKDRLKEKMDTTRFIQMANKMPMYSIGLLNRRLWELSSFPKQISKAIHSDNPPGAQGNPYMKKYADKIASLQRSSIETVPIINEKSVPKCDSQQVFSTVQSCLYNERSRDSSVSQKTLGSIMKLELLKDKTAEEIESIWKQYFEVKDGLYAIASAAAYQQIISKSVEFPSFLYPIPKGSGYEFILGQFRGNSCYFTPLQDYQLNKDNAHVSLTITYYPELMAEKGIVLMRGEFDENVLKAQEAQCLANQLQMYYGNNSAKKQKLLFLFNREPQNFHYMDVISELQISLS